MTEKRFSLIKNNGTDECYLDNLYDNDTYIGSIGNGSEMICYLLNSLNDENKQLIHDATILIQANDDYRKEIEEVKKDLEVLVRLIDFEDKGEKKWWRCEHFTSPLGVAFCSKNENFCKRRECGDDV